MGWIPDLPDARDYTYRHADVLPLLKRLKRASRARLPDETDLRADAEGEYFTPPGDQGTLHCSAAFAVLSLFEYFERRVAGRTFEGSNRFLYKVTRNLLHAGRRVIGDTGADLRTTLKALLTVGVPPEPYFPYDVDKFDDEPSPFLYSLAKTPRGVLYFRIDERGRDGHSVWQGVRSFLAAGFPIAFGLPVPSSLTAAAEIPFRPSLDSIRGGQAVLAVGYRNDHFGHGQHALLIRNSWGSQWGDNGNGWVPAAFVCNQLARNFWTVVSPDWVDSRELSRPRLVDADQDSPQA